MGKDSANRWLEEIEDVYYLVRASELEGDTALAHPYVSFHFFFPHQALYHPLRDFESEDKDSASCLGPPWKTLRDILSLKYLPSELLYFYISNHFFKTDNRQGVKTLAHSSSPVPLKVVVTARRPGLSTDPAHRFGLRAIKEPPATLMSQVISP